MLCAPSLPERSLRRRLLRATVWAAACAVIPGAALAAPRSDGSGAGGPGGARGAAPLAVNLALGATSGATSAAAGQPAGNAVDGSASTAWCATQWTGTLTVDLGRPRMVDALGITLATGASDSTVAVALSSSGAADAGWQPLASAQNIALTGGAPSYVPLPRRQAVRSARVTVTTGDGRPACVGELRLLGPSPATDAMMLGGDLSFTNQELAAGTRFTDAGRPGTPVTIMRAHGGNFVRMRLWVNPPAGYSDLANDLALARQVRAAGMKVYLDLHYSDFWADPQHEDSPAAWAGQDLATLAATVRGYTRDVLAAFARQGTPVDLVSIGNEIRNGMLWPVGRVDWAADTGWDSLAALLRAGIDGARAANPAHHPLRIMIHFDQGGSSAAAQRFFANLTSRGVDFDVIGLSYYTFFHGPVTALRETVNALADRFGKDIVIAEMQYAWTLANGDTTGNFVWQPSQVEAGYPATPGGQLSIANDVLSILAAAPGGHGAGLFYWEPEWVPGVGWEPGAGAPNDNLTLYDFQGRALPSIGLFENPAAVCQRLDRAAVLCVLP